MMFTLSEVECLGACVNAPLIAINDDYYVRRYQLIFKKNDFKYNRKYLLIEYLFSYFSGGFNCR